MPCAQQSIEGKRKLMIEVIGMNSLVQLSCT